jgi:hypothetical protein
MIPAMLYKYVTPERIDILSRKRIRFTQPCFLNDPFEFLPGAPMPGAEGIGHFEAKIAGERGENYRNKARLSGILSLASKADSIPMWAHYAAGHKGFVIGLDTATEPFDQAIAAGKLRRVRYQQDRISLTRGSGGQAWVGPDGIFHTKSTDWQYEQEWRWLECCDPGKYADLVTGPDGELLYLRPIPSHSIRQVIVGHRAARILIESLLALKLTADYRHLELLKIALHESSYTLEIEPLG